MKRNPFSLNENKLALVESKLVEEKKPTISDPISRLPNALFSEIINFLPMDEALIGAGVNRDWHKRVNNKKSLNKLLEIRYRQHTQVQHPRSLANRLLQRPKMAEFNDYFRSIMILNWNMFQFNLSLVMIRNIFKNNSDYFVVQNLIPDIFYKKEDFESLQKYLFKILELAEKLSIKFSRLPTDTKKIDDDAIKKLFEFASLVEYVAGMIVDVDMAHDAFAMFQPGHNYNQRLLALFRNHAYTRHITHRGFLAICYLNKPKLLDDLAAHRFISSKFDVLSKQELINLFKAIKWQKLDGVNLLETILKSPVIYKKLDLEEILDLCCKEVEQTKIILSKLDTMKLSEQGFIFFMGSLTNHFNREEIVSFLEEPTVKPRMTPDVWFKLANNNQVYFALLIRHPKVYTLFEPDQLESFHKKLDTMVIHPVHNHRKQTKASNPPIRVEEKRIASKPIAQTKKESIKAQIDQAAHASKYYYDCSALVDFVLASAEAHPQLDTGELSRLLFLRELESPSNIEKFYDLGMRILNAMPDKPKEVERIIGLAKEVHERGNRDELKMATEVLWHTSAFLAKRDKGLYQFISHHVGEMHSPFALLFRVAMVAVAVTALAVTGLYCPPVAIGLAVVGIGLFACLKPKAGFKQEVQALVERDELVNRI